VPRLTLAGIAIINPSPEFLLAESSETIFNIQEAWGENYYVVAESLIYEAWA
jgi:hypothetical protein